MKILTILFALLISSTNAFAQNDIKIKEAKDKLIKQVDSLRKHKPLDDYNGSWIAELEKEFYLDTLYVERLWVLEIDYNSSTMGMVQANQLAAADYDSLLNKYYGKLLFRLEGEDKEKLKISQRNWIKFRDSEKQINYTLFDKQYSGGGSIHKIFVSNKNAEITKQRVIELYEYLDRIWSPKKQ